MTRLRLILSLLCLTSLYVVEARPGISTDTFSHPLRIQSRRPFIASDNLRAIYDPLLFTPGAFVQTGMDAFGRSNFGITRYGTAGYGGAQIYPNSPRQLYSVHFPAPIMPPVYRGLYATTGIIGVAPINPGYYGQSTLFPHATTMVVKEHRLSRGKHEDEYDYDYDDDEEEEDDKKYEYNENTDDNIDEEDYEDYDDPDTLVMRTKSFQTSNRNKFPVRNLRKSYQPTERHQNQFYNNKRQFQNPFKTLQALKNGNQYFAHKKNRINVNYYNTLLRILYASQLKNQINQQNPTRSRMAIIRNINEQEISQIPSNINEYGQAKTMQRFLNYEKLKQSTWD